MLFITLSIALVQIQNQNMEATLATEYRIKNKSVQESLVRVRKYLLCDLHKFLSREVEGRNLIIMINQSSSFPFASQKNHGSFILPTSQIKAKWKFNIFLPKLSI